MANVLNTEDLVRIIQYNTTNKQTNKAATRSSSQWVLNRSVFHSLNYNCAPFLTLVSEIMIALALVATQIELKLNCESR
jgi:hypothetical protein